MSTKLYECPLCHNITLGELPPRTGDSFMLTTVDTKSKTFYPSGIPVKVMACTNCKYLLLQNESISFIPNEDKI